MQLHIDIIFVDQCSWGTPWRKRTRLLCAFIDAHDVDPLRSHVCHGKKVCEFTIKKHIQLTGADPSGVPLTFRAQTFPVRMANQLGDCICSKDLANRLRCGAAAQDPCFVWDEG